MYMFSFGSLHCCHIKGLALSQKNFQKSKIIIKKSSHPILHMQVCASLQQQFIGNNRSLEVVHTSFAGAWHAHLCDGSDNCVVSVAFANQINYPVCDLFNWAPVQAMVLSRLQMTSKKQSMTSVSFRLACLLMSVFTFCCCH